MKTAIRTRLSAALLAATMTVPFAAQAGDTPATQQKQNQELEQARKALEEAQREFARAAAEMGRAARAAHSESPRAEAYEFIFNSQRAMLGVTIDDSTEKSPAQGVVITGVTPGSGAEKAGIKSGDLLLSANGESLAPGKGETQSPSRKLLAVMSELKPGDPVALEYLREGKRAKTTAIASRPQPMVPHVPAWAWRDEHDFDVLVPPLPPMPPSVPRAPMEGDPLRMSAAGSGADLQLASLNPDLATYFKTQKGVLVVQAPSVDKDNTLGLKSGDVIQSIDGSAVEHPVEAWERLLEHRGKKPLQVEVMRQGKQHKLQGLLVARSGHRLERRIIKIDAP